MPFIPEFIAGVWPWYLKPTTPHDEEFVSRAAIMHGIKGFSRYMIVERDRWMGSPIAKDGYIRKDRYQVHKKFIETLRKYEFVKFDKKSEVLILLDREYDRLEAATALISFPGDFLEPLLGFSEYPNALYISEDTFGFEEPIQIIKTLWFERYYKVLTDLGYTFNISDSELDIERMKQYKAICIPSFEFMTQKLQDKIIEVAKNGSIVVLGPKVPKFNEYFDEYSAINNAISLAQKIDITHGSRTVAVEYKLGKGAIVLIKDINDLSHAIESIFKLYNVHKIEKTPVTIDTVLHENRETPNEAMLFIANPTSQHIKATVTLPYDVKEIVEVWSEKRFPEVRDELVDEIPPYTIRTYLLLKR
jgi:beta-galactosidase